MKDLEAKLIHIKELTSDRRTLGRFSYIDPDEAIALLATGLRMPQVAEIYGCIANTVTYHIKIKYPGFNALTDIKRRRIGITPKEAAKLYGRLKSTTKVGGILGTSSKTIAKRLREAGIEPQKTSREDISDESILRLYKKYKTARIVGVMVGMSKNSVLQRLHKIGAEIDYSYRNRRTDLPGHTIRRDYKAGKTIKYLIDRYSSSYETITRVIVEEGGQLRGQKREDVTVKSAVRLYKKYGQLAKVARELKASPGTIRSRLTEEDPNIIVQFRRARPDIPVEDLIRRYEAKETLESLSDRYSSCQKTLKRILKENKVKLRKPGDYSRRRDITPGGVARAYRSLKGVGAVMRALDISAYVFYDRLEKAGLEVDPSYRKERESARRRTDIPAKEVVRLYNSGASKSALAEKYDADRETIRRIIDKPAK